MKYFDRNRWSVFQEDEVMDSWGDRGILLKGFTAFFFFSSQQIETEAGLTDGILILHIMSLKQHHAF